MKRLLLLIVLQMFFTERGRLYAQSSISEQNQRAPDVIEGRIAVLPILNNLGNKATLSRDEIHVLTTLLQDDVQKQTQRSFQVMTDENIRQLLPPGKRLEDCKGDCEVEYGRELGAHFIITGSLVKFGKKKNSMRLIIKMHDTKAGTLQNTVMIQGVDAEEMESQLEAKVIELIAPLKAKEKLMKMDSQTTGDKSLKDKLRISLSEKNTDSQISTQGQGLTQNQEIDYEGELKLLEMEKQQKKAHQQEIDQEWNEILDLIRQGNLDRSLEVVNLFLAKYQQHPLGNHRLVEAGQAMNRLQTQIEERRQKNLQRVHLEKLREAYGQFVKPLLKKGDDQAKIALDVFLKEYENHPLGNPLAQEALTFYEQRRSAYEAEMKAVFVSEITLEWTRLKSSVDTGGDRAIRVVEMFLKKYEGGKWENPFEQEARDVLAALKVGKGIQKVSDSGGSGEKGRERSNLIEWEMIRGGSFMMGSEDGYSDEKPVHSVEVRDFYMSKTEVTVGQYRKCVQAGGCSEPIDKNSNSSCNWGYIDKENHPINCVDWKQARTFAKWVGGDLPSEAQWEYVARSGGREIKYPWGNAEATCQYAVMDDGGDGCGNVGTWEVCSKTEGNTVKGLCDMGGNVFEWVLDEYHGSYSGAPSDDSGWCSDRGCDGNTSASRVSRGGSWYGTASSLRSALRDRSSPSLRSDDLGFRVSDTLP